MRAAMKGMKSGKGWSRWHTCGHMKMLTRLFNIVNSDRMYEHWKTSELVLIFKNYGDVQDLQWDEADKPNHEELLKLGYEERG